MGKYTIDPAPLHGVVFDFRPQPSDRKCTFFKNRKLKIPEPEVESMLIVKNKKIYNIGIILFLRYFDQGRRQSLPKIFAPYVRVYGHTRAKMILVPPMVEISKNKDGSLITKTNKLFNRTLFDFRFRRFPLPVFKKRATSGLKVRTGSRK